MKPSKVSSVQNLSKNTNTPEAFVDATSTRAKENPQVKVKRPVEESHDWNVNQPRDTKDAKFIGLEMV